MLLFPRSDIGPIIDEALHAYKKLDQWIKPEKAPFDANLFVFSPKVHKQPKGVVLIISPFNYPLWCSAPIVSPNLKSFKPFIEIITDRSHRRWLWRGPKAI